MSRDTGIERRQCRGATVFCAVVYDKTTGRKTSKTFDTITAARQWRTDAMSALRAGTMTADRGPTLREAASQWLQDARDGHVRDRSGDPYKPSAIRGYEKNLRLRVLPALGDRRLGDIQPRDVQHVLDKLQRDGVSASTIDTTLTPLKAIYRRARTAGSPPPTPRSGSTSPPSAQSRAYSPPLRRRTPCSTCSPARPAPCGRPRCYAGLRRGELWPSAGRT